MITRKTTTPMLRTIVCGVLIGALVTGPSAIAQSVSSAGVVSGSGYNSVDIDVGLVVLTKHQPREASLGQQYEVMIEVKVVEKVADITVTDAVPKGASFVRSEPQGKRDGKNLTWNFKNLNRGDSRVIKIYLRPERQGDLSSCATVTAIPQCCVTTFVGKAEVNIAKSGPTQVKLGEDIDYSVTVTNTGSAIARDVVVIDTVPNGLTHASGKRTLTFDVGTLEPQQSHDMMVTLNAVQRGQLCNNVVVKSSNAGTDTAEACTVVVQELIEITKQGPKEQFLGKKARYNIVVTNLGDTTLTNVVVADHAPAATDIVTAGNASVAGNMPEWRIPELRAGGHESREITLTTMTAGIHCNEVEVTSAEGLTDSAKTCTLWRGYPAVLLEVIDTEDPLLTGETTTYVIRVTNQGTADDTNVTIIARFPNEISPVSASGDSIGRVAGKMVTFAPYPVIKPKEVVEWRIKAKAEVVGDSRLTLEMDTSLLKTPVTEEESTHVY